MKAVRSVARVCLAVMLVAVLVTGCATLSAQNARPKPAVIYTKANAPAVPKLEELTLTDRVTKDTITWTFEKPARVGAFVTGDVYVVGPVTVTSVTPPPGGGRNGSCLNPPVNSDGASPYDDRVTGGRGANGVKLRAAFPVSMKPGDVLVSSISVPALRTIPDFLRPPDKNLSPVGSVSILTCVKEPVAPDAFRPGYCDREQKLYYARDLKRDILTKLPRAGVRMEYDYGKLDIAWMAEHYRRPWMDLCFFSFDAPISYMPQYGRELGRAASIGSLMLLLDFTPQEKEPLLIGMVQYGIDLWGAVRAGHHGWQAFGGHGSGRKLPLTLAGMLLDDADMQSPYAKFPKLELGEDMQVKFDACWTGAKVVYAGHYGKDATGQYGPYEHLQPKAWLSDMNESYRRCCTSNAWIGQALAFRILHAEKTWNNDAFFAYCDRWMTEDDTEFVKEIKAQRGTEYASWAWQRQTWDPFINDLWKKYRTNLPRPADRHTDPGPEVTWK